MNKYIVILFTLVSALSLAQETTMNASEIEAFKQQVSTVSKNTKSITSDFVQFKHLDFLDNDIKTEGKLAFKAPALVRWEYTNPYQYVVVFKGDKLLINDGGTKSDMDIGNSDMFKKLNALIVNSVKGTMFNDADFKITYAKTGRYNKATFVPKEKKMLGYIAAFELLFDKTDGTVKEVKMIEPSEDFTRIIFSNRILNNPVSDALFTH
jgi:outer membrane lipoprotein-sorting protein